MGLFSDVLLTVDFDRTLTAPDSTIPQRNLDAIRWFMERGGAFTVNTGRSIPMYRPQKHRVQTNVPLLLYNGSAAWDVNGELVNCIEIPLDPKALIEDLQSRFPELLVEEQGKEHHYLFDENPDWVEFCENNRCAWAYARAEDAPRPFLKLALSEKRLGKTVSSMFDADEATLARFDQAQAYVESRYGDTLQTFRAAPKIVDIHAKGVSKAAAARRLLADLGRKILVCVGDAENDLLMLQGADYAYCPADGFLADRFETVCNCADGAVAHVIYEKIPQILGIQP